MENIKVFVEERLEHLTAREAAKVYIVLDWASSKFSDIAEHVRRSIRTLRNLLTGSMRNSASWTGEYMNWDEEIIKHIAPNLYIRINNVEQEIKQLGEKIDSLSMAVSTLQDSLMNMAKGMSELKGRSESAEERVMLRLKADFLERLVLRLIEPDGKSKGDGN